MSEPGIVDLYQAAAQAAINARCAPAYLHDLRGSLQAIFSAFELLSRSARSGGGDPARVEKACDLARRAMSRHENSLTEAFQVLAAQVTPAALDLAVLTQDVAHFLRNEAGVRRICVTVESSAELIVWAERPKLQTLLAGLLIAAIDAVGPAGELPVHVERVGDDVAVSIVSTAWADVTPPEPDGSWRPPSQVQPKELTLAFARELLAVNRGRLKVDETTRPPGSLTLYYPAHPSG